MRLSKRRHTTLPVMNMTPMIDVVFQLLIFFMTVSQVSEIDHMQLDLPRLRGSEDQKSTMMVVNVAQDGQRFVTGQPVTLSQLITLLSQELAQLGDDPSRLNVVIRADQRGASRAVNETMTALARLQIARVRIAVEVPSSGTGGERS